MQIKCSTCDQRISAEWLVLGMPWSRFRCQRCGSVYAGTLLRLAMISVCTGVLGYLVIGVIKGKISPLFLPLPAVITLAVLFLDLPLQIKKVEESDTSKDGGSP